MGTRKTEDLGECAYCPNPATTKDDNPPRGMFAKGMPNKPWVPSCLDPKNPTPHTERRLSANVDVTGEHNIPRQIAFGVSDRRRRETT
jgi:hypothetical protein